MPETRKTLRQIVGVSMTPEMALEFKKEAAARGMSLRALFEEMWLTYQKQKDS